MMSFFVGRLIGTLWTQILALLAYGPWPRFLHQCIIRIYRRLYQIEWDDISGFKNLGEFFLREIQFEIGNESLVSPAECAILEGPEPIRLDQKISVKGVEYCWKDFHEWKDHFSSGSFYNFYLAPVDYHWVHAPCDGIRVQAIRTPGLKIPVNQLGRSLCPKLYLQNDRLSFQWEHPEFGHVWMIMVGAMGVSRIRSELGPIGESWTPLSDIKKGQRIGAFELGSSILLVLERGGKFRTGLKKLRPGFNLLRS